MTSELLPEAAADAPDGGSPHPISSPLKDDDDAEASSSQVDSNDCSGSSFIVVSDRETPDDMAEEGEDKAPGSETSNDVSTSSEELEPLPAADSEPESDESIGSEPEESPPRTEDATDGKQAKQQETERQLSKEEQKQQIAAILHNIIETVDPHHYSIATFKDPDRALGLKLWELDQGGMLVMGISDGQANSIFAGATSDTYPVDGDVLIGVNGHSCTGAKTTLMDVKKMVDQSQGRILSLTFRRPESKTMMQQQQKKNKNKNDPTLTEGCVQRLTILNPRTASVSLDEIEFVGEKKDPIIDESEEVLAAEGEDETTPLSENPEAKIEPSPAEQQPVLLQIQSISFTSWLSACTCLSEGQVILKIQDIPCFDMTPAEVKVLWQDELNKDPHSLTITTYKLPQVKGRNRFRRALIGVGGSVLVGAGVMIMATPLHPLGHALALGGGHVMTYGGLGVIGSQIKGSKKKGASEGEASPSASEKRSLKDRWSSVRRRRTSSSTKEKKDQSNADESKQKLPSTESSNDDIISGEEREVDLDDNDTSSDDKRTSFLQRARQSWRNRGRSSSSDSFEDLDDEILEMEQALALEAK